MPTSNKVKFGLRNVHYAPLTLGSDNTYSFGTPVPIPGAVDLSMEANGEPSVFYADCIAYYVTNNNNGYNGDLEIALIPDSFRTACLSETLDSANVLVEDSNAEPSPFALLFEFKGDQKHIRHVLYNCVASRPSVSGKTDEENKDVQTEKLSLSALPLPDGKVKAKTGDSTSSTVYDAWYTTVHVPSSSSSSSSGSGTTGG